MECPAEQYSVPLLLPPLLAFLASTVRGVSGFGDGITFQSLWLLCAALGLVPGLHSPSACYAMRKAVLYSTIMQVVTMPAQAWQAREHLRVIAGYTLPMALAGSGLTVVGANLLLRSASSTLRPLIGSLFLVFSVVQLALKARAQVARLHAQPQPQAQQQQQLQQALPPALPVVVEEEEEEEKEGGEEERSTLVPSGAAPAPAVAAGAIATAGSGGEGCPAAAAPAAAAWVPPLPSPAEIEGMLASARAQLRAEGSASARAPSTPALSPALIPAAPSPCCALPPALARYLPALSPVLSPLPMLLLLVPAAMCGGVLGGLMGAGGPPLMAAYSVLDLDKDVLRGFGVVPSCFMLVRLALYTGSEGAVAQASEAALYAMIMAGGLAGVFAGGRLRPWVDGERVVLLILALGWVAGGLLLGLFVEAGVTVGYGVGAVGAAGLWAAAARSARCAARLGCGGGGGRGGVAQG